ncbi:methyltransferase domain-containing protein [Flavobacterium sp. TMP13]|uniref:methyltransferase domain-containing protein n=1 Tax=Flavobacterium sp. TMP13 TaxID=3425950 RepID=UPI003D77685E
MKLTKEYWEDRYQQQQTAWDIGSISTPLKEYIDQLTDKSLSILIPGGGNSYELEYLLENGFESVFVVDFATTPLQNIRKRIPHLQSEQLIQADFFELEGRFDLILEQTFFCALNPYLREKYVEKVKSLLKPNGKVAGVFFQFPLTEVGPPFGGSKTEYENLFRTNFRIKSLETAYNSIKPRRENELFFIFEKK